MWMPAALTEENLRHGLDPENIILGHLNDEPIATMILQWQDPIFWPDANANSGFIHKLCIRRAHAGQGYSAQMINWAKAETLRRGRNFLRLDCAADRPKLCAFYERHGFTQVDRKKVGPFDTAFYELALN